VLTLEDARVRAGTTATGVGTREGRAHTP